MQMSIQYIAITVALLIEGVPLNFVLSGKAPARELNRKLLSCGISRSDRARIIQATAEEYYNRGLRDTYRQFLHVASRLELTPRESEGAGPGRV